MELLLQRLKNDFPTRTPGEFRVNAVFFGYTVEDQVREIPGRPVEEWKIDGKTAIPAGRYWVTLENSPRFGPETITIHDVPGFQFIRMHSGNTEEHTEGCPLGGYELTRGGTIAVGQTRPMIANLKRNIREARDRAEGVFINVANPKET